LIGLWGFQRSEFTPVDLKPADVDRLLRASPRMADIVIKGGQVSSRNSAVKLDLGGYAKGYALDRAAAYLRGEGVKGALVNIGGNIIAIGRHGDRPWRVGIQHPRKPGPLATLELPDGWAIGTSGDYQRFFELGGKRYCHIIDPRSGYPVQGVQAVTILVPPGSQAGTLSDAASKPIFISGAAGWRAAAAGMGIGHALLIDGQGRLHLTQAMAQRLQFVEKNVPLEILP
jgi:thiamine biosynthesis lipoprotein